MTNKPNIDVIIVGGSYAGLSAAMSLGRALRNVLVIDSGKPCNRQTPHSHNFLTLDGKTPQHITASAREQVARYETVKFHDGFVISGAKRAGGFDVTTQAGEVFSARKLILATGIKDIMPAIGGFAECWGISVIHCPYCHGYEVRNEKTGILGNGEYGFEFSKMISHWTKDLTLFTNGASTLTEEQTALLKKHAINIVESEVDHLEHQSGYIQDIVFKDGHRASLKALYARPAFVQHSDLPASLGCAFNEQGLITVDILQKTNVPGVSACGDNSHAMRAVSVAVAAGSMAGAGLNKELIAEDF